MMICGRSVAHVIKMSPFPVRQNWGRVRGLGAQGDLIPHGDINNAHRVLLNHYNNAYHGQTVRQGSQGRRPTGGDAPKVFLPVHSLLLVKSIPTMRLQSFSPRAFSADATSASVL